MSETPDDLSAPEDEAASAAPARKRPKPGERRIQILQTLASMLEQPGADRITTAALAAKLQVSDARRLELGYIFQARGSVQIMGLWWRA